MLLFDGTQGLSCGAESGEWIYPLEGSLDVQRQKGEKELARFERMVLASIEERERGTRSGSRAHEQRARGNLI